MLLEVKWFTLQSPVDGAAPRGPHHQPVRPRSSAGCWRGACPDPSAAPRPGQRRPPAAAAASHPDAFLPNRNLLPCRGGACSTAGESVACNGVSGRKEPAGFQTNRVYTNIIKCFRNTGHFVIYVTVFLKAQFTLKNPNLYTFYNSLFKKKKSENSLLLIIGAENKCSFLIPALNIWPVLLSQNFQYLRGTPDLDFNFLTNICVSNR